MNFFSKTSLLSYCISLAQTLLQTGCLDSQAASQPDRHRHTLNTLQFQSYPTQLINCLELRYNSWQLLLLSVLVTLCLRRHRRSSINQGLLMLASYLASACVTGWAVNQLVS